MTSMAWLTRSIITATAMILAGGCAVFSPPPPPLPPLTQQEQEFLQEIGGEVLPDGNLCIGAVTIHRREREIAFPARINMTRGELEVLICTERGRRHESLLVCAVKPLNLQLAMILLGWENGARKDGRTVAQGDLLAVDVLPPGGKRIPIESWLFNKKTDQVQPPGAWVFVGSSFNHEGTCSAEIDGNIINLWSFGGTVLDNPDKTGDTDDWFDVATDHVPPFETPVTVFLRRMPPLAPAE